MARTVKSRSSRKSKQDPGTNARETRAIDPIKMRRYLAFVRAVVGAASKGNAR